LWEAVVSSTAWGGSPTGSFYVSHQGSGDPSHTGDGTSSLIITGLSLTPLTDYAPLMAESITRTADTWAWTTPAAVPHNAELTHLGWQPHADGDMNIANQTWATSSGYLQLYRQAATILRTSDNSGGGKTADITRTLPNRSILFVQRKVLTPTGIAAGYSSTIGTPTAGGPTWEGPTSLIVGRAGVAGRASRAGNALIITPGGCTQEERDAAGRMFHLKTLAAAA
jgi:hypothetical protein